MEELLQFIYHYVQIGVWILSFVCIVGWLYQNYTTANVSHFDAGMFVMVWFIWTNSIFENYKI